MTETLTVARTSRQLAILVAATATGSVGLAAGGTAGALLAVSVIGEPATAGLPLGVLVTGSAAGALAIAAATARLGRGRALALGYALGAAGAALVAVAASSSLAGVLAGSFLMGAANAAVFLTRYAAADLAGPHARGRGLGVVLAGATVGAVAGPNLLGPSRALAAALGLPGLAGLYLVAIPSFAIAAALLARLPTGHWTVPADPIPTRLRRWPPITVAGLGLLSAANLVMVGVMAVAPLHMTDHGHDLGFVGMAASLHVVGMFALAPGLGWLADRLGSTTVAGLGAGLLVVVGAGATSVDLAAGASITVYLILLGVGWSSAVVGGSGLLVAALPPAVRPRGEAMGEVAMGLGAAAGAPGAAILLAAGGFPALTLTGVGVAGLALSAMVLATVRGREPHPECKPQQPQQPQQPINVLKESIMTATYTFDVFSSLDGFGAHNGDWGGYWGKQGPQFLDRRLALYSEEQRMVFGASTYRAHVQMLASGIEESELSDPWVTRMRNLPATVVSATLREPLDWPDATVVRGDAVEVVAQLKVESEVPLRSHGSLSMNRALMAAGLVDRVQVTLFPVICGQTGADPIFQDAADFDLELIETRTLDGHTQELIYRPTLHV